MTIATPIDFLHVVLVGFAFGIGFAVAGWVVGKILR